jgi:TRAP-type C4-dicarboxylate transport system permease small subunit
VIGQANCKIKKGGGEHNMMIAISRLYLPFIVVASYANKIGTIVIFFLVATMNYDVVARGFFHAPLNGVVEVVIFSLILIVFLQLPDVVHHNRLTRSDGFLNFIYTRAPSIGDVLSRSINAIGCLFMGLIAWTMWPDFLESIESCHFITAPEFGVQHTGELWTDLKVAFGRCDYFGTPGIFTAPWWPAKLAIFFSVTMCCGIFLFKVMLGPYGDSAASKSDASIAVKGTLT